MDLKDVQTFEQLEAYLRGFTNALGDPAPYDVGGAFALFAATLDNLTRHHLDVDMQDYGTALPLTAEQRAFLAKLLRLHEREQEV